MSIVSETMKTMRNSPLASAVGLAVLGLLLLVFPGASLGLLIRLAGIVLLVFSGLGTAAFFTGHTGHSNEAKLQLVLHLVILVLGILFLFCPGRVKAIFGTVLGIMLILSSLKVLVRLIRFGGDGRTWPLIQAGVILIAGIVFLFVPNSAANTAAKIAGICFLLQAVTNLLTDRSMKRGSKTDSTVDNPFRR